MTVIPGAVREKFDAIIEKAGHSFPVETILDIVQEERMKPLYILDVKLASSISGYAFGLMDADVIAIRSNIEPERRPSVILHECAHILLGHVIDNPYTFHQFKRAQRKLIKTLRYHQPITAYDDPIEYAAEVLAMLFLERVDEYDKLLSSAIISMYGHKA